MLPIQATIPFPSSNFLLFQPPSSLTSSHVHPKGYFQPQSFPPFSHSPHPPSPSPSLNHPLTPTPPSNNKPTPHTPDNTHTPATSRDPSHVAPRVPGSPPLRKKAVLLAVWDVVVDAEGRFVSLGQVLRRTVEVGLSFGRRGGRRGAAAVVVVVVVGVKRIRMLERVVGMVVGRGVVGAGREGWVVC